MLACNQLACEHEPLVYDQLELVWHVYVYTYIHTYLCTCGHLCLFECTYYDNWTCCVCVCGYVCEISVCVFCFLLSLLSSPTTPILPFSLSSHSPSFSLSPPFLPPYPPYPSPILPLLIQLTQGTLLTVPSSLVKRCKTHFHNMLCGASIILGNNGWVWVSPQVLDDQRQVLYGSSNMVAEASTEGGQKEKVGCGKGVLSVCVCVCVHAHAHGEHVCGHAVCVMIQCSVSV